MKYSIICDYCENFESKTDIGHVNDHQTRKTFEEINRAINNLGVECNIFGGVPELISAYKGEKEIDNQRMYLNLSDGTNKRYSRVQIPIICDLLSIMYSGGGPFETALTSNKYYCSRAVKEYGFSIPRSTLVNNHNDLQYIKNYKSIIKPNSEGSSIGISEDSVCDTDIDIKNQALKLLSKFPEVLVEEYIPGYDVTCFVIGNDKIELCEVLSIEHHGKVFFTNEVMEYKDHILETRHFIPSSGIIPEQVLAKIKDTSITIKNKLKLYDFCRIDYRITEDNEIYFLEINTVPAISMDSQVGTICKMLKISFEEFMQFIINSVTNRFNHV